MEKKLKIRELKPAPDGEVGYIRKNGAITEPHEDSTFVFLAQFGFDIECIIKNHTPKTHNADISMMGTIWEVKSPESSNKKTLKKRIHTASTQSSHVVFDLRRVRAQFYTEVEKEVIQRFRDKASFRHMLLITNDGRLLDILK